MKKNFILGVFLIGLFVVSFVSAGWFGDFIGKFSSTGNVVDLKGIPIDEEVVSKGIGLSKGSNYYFIWNGESAPISEIVSSLEGKISSIKEASSKTNEKKTKYWYGDGNTKNSIKEFTKGEKYTIVVKEHALWELKISKYAGIKENFGEIKYLSKQEIGVCSVPEPGSNQSEECHTAGETTMYEILKNEEGEIKRTGGVVATVSEKEGANNAYSLTKYWVKDVERQDRKFYVDFDKKQKVYIINYLEKPAYPSVEVMVFWESQNNLVVSLSFEYVGGFNQSIIQGAMENFEKLLDAYLEKYPSNLPEDSPVPAIENSGSSGGGSSNSSNEIVGEYVDFTSCEFKLETTSGISCDYDQVIGAVTHQDCADLTHPRIVGTAWSGNRIPNYFDYQCKDGSTPTIAYYCCDVKGVPNTGSNTRSASNEHSSRLDSEGKIVLY